MHKAVYIALHIGSILPILPAGWIVSDWLPQFVILAKIAFFSILGIVQECTMN